MDTIDNAVDYLRHNDTPFWWIMSGKQKVGESGDTENLEESIIRFRESCKFLPDGSYTLKCTNKLANHSGALMLPFVKSLKSATPMQPIPVHPSTNPHGIPDNVYAEIVRKTEQEVLFRQMHDKFVVFMEEWPKYRDKINNMYDHLKDDNGDGTPDFMQALKKSGEMVNAASEMKTVVQNSKLFR